MSSLRVLSSAHLTCTIAPFPPLLLISICRTCWLRHVFIFKLFLRRCEQRPSGPRPTGPATVLLQFPANPPAAATAASSSFCVSTDRLCWKLYAATGNRVPRSGPTADLSSPSSTTPVHWLSASEPASANFLLSATTSAVFSNSTVATATAASSGSSKASADLFTDSAIIQYWIDSASFYADTDQAVKQDSKHQTVFYYCYRPSKV